MIVVDVYVDLYNNWINIKRRGKSHKYLLTNKRVDKIKSIMWTKAQIYWGWGLTLYRVLDHENAPEGL